MNDKIANRCYFSYAILGVVWRMRISQMNYYSVFSRIESLEYKIRREGRIYKSKMRPSFLHLIRFMYPNEFVFPTLDWLDDKWVDR